MALINQFIYFVNGILSINITDNITILDIFIYLILTASVIKFLKIAVKGNNK